jgi:hypothetical protein
MLNDRISILVVSPDEDHRLVRAILRRSNWPKVSPERVRDKRGKSVARQCYREDVPQA